MEEILPLRDPRIAPDNLDIQSFRKALDNRLVLGNVFTTNDERLAFLDFLIDDLAAQRPIPIDKFRGFSGNRAVDLFKEMWRVGYEAEADRLCNAMDDQFEWSADRDSFEMFSVEQLIAVGRASEAMPILERLAEGRPPEIGFLCTYIRGLHQSSQSDRVAEELVRLPELFNNSKLASRPQRLLDPFRHFGILERDASRLYDIARIEPNNIFVRTALISMGAADSANLVQETLELLVHQPNMTDRTLEIIIEKGFHQEVFEHMKPYGGNKALGYVNQVRLAFARIKSLHANDPEGGIFTSSLFAEAEDVLFPGRKAHAEQMQIHAERELQQREKPVKVKPHPAADIEVRSVILIGRVVTSLANNDIRALAGSLQRMRAAQSKGRLSATSIQDLIRQVPDILTMHFMERKTSVMQPLSNLLSGARAGFSGEPIRTELDKLVPVIKFLYERNSPERSPPSLIRQREWKAATSLFTGRIGHYDSGVFSDDEKEYMRFYSRIQHTALLAQRRDVLVYLAPWTARLPSQFGRVVYQLVAIDGKRGREGIQAIEAIKKNTSAVIFRDALIHAEKLLLASFGAIALPPTKLPVIDAVPRDTKPKQRDFRIRTSPVMRQLGTRIPADGTASQVTEYRGVNRKGRETYKYGRLGRKEY